MFKTLRTVIYKVNDLAAAKEWYTVMTGQEPYFDQPFYTGFNINGCELGLDPDMSNTTTGNQSVAYWAVDDLAASLEKLVANGASVIQSKTNVGGEIFLAIIKDPFNNYIGLIQGA